MSSPRRKSGEEGHCQYFLLSPRPLKMRSPRTPKSREALPHGPRAPHTARGSQDKDKRLEDADDLCPSVCSEKFSVYSEASNVSRLTQLSRKSLAKRCLSSKELEELEVMEKRREVSAMLRRNQVNCRKALHATDLSNAGRVQSHAKLTQPKEFRLSCPPTPRSPGSPLPSCAELDTSEVDSIQGDYFSRSLRTSRSCQSLESSKGWRPQLTVPKGPELRTVRRVSLGRRPSSCPPTDDEDVAPPHAKTPRHRVEIRRPVDTERRPVTRTPGKMVVTPVTRPAPRPTNSAVKVAKQGGHRIIRAKDLEHSDRKENVKPGSYVVKRSPSDEFLSRSGPASPVSGGGLSCSRSTKLLRGGFAGAQQAPPGMRVSFGSTTPRPCCI